MDDVEEVKEVEVVALVAVDVALLTVEVVLRSGVDGPRIVDGLVDVRLRACLVTGWLRLP